MFIIAEISLLLNSDFLILELKDLCKALEGAFISFKICSKRLRSEGVMALQTLGGERVHKLEIKHV
jgi:hypothetical protein